MYTLIFDTTASACSIVLCKDGKVIDCYDKIFDFGQAEVLIPEIKNMLLRNKLAFSEIEGTFVCVGPGSFTGVRASVSAAKAFALAYPNMIISGFSAFDAYILDLAEDEIAACNAVIIETKRDDFYVCFYDAKLSAMSEPQVLSRDEIINFLKKQGNTISVIGDGITRFLNQSTGLVFHSIKVTDSISVEALSKIAFLQQKNRKFNFPKPLYIRAADVTINSQKQG